MGRGCNRKGSKGHQWMGNGPDRVCKHCGKKPKETHISTRYEGGEDKYREQVEQMKLDRKSLKGNKTRDVQWEGPSRVESIRKRNK